MKNILAAFHPLALAAVGISLETISTGLSCCVLVLTGIYTYYKIKQIIKELNKNNHEKN